MQIIKNLAFSIILITLSACGNDDERQSEQTSSPEVKQENTLFVDQIEMYEDAKGIDKLMNDVSNQKANAIENQIE